MAIGSLLKNRPLSFTEKMGERLGKLAKSFKTVDHTGPKFLAAFEEVTDEEDRTLIERDAFERVNYLLKKLGIV